MSIHAMLEHLSFSAQPEAEAEAHLDGTVEVLVEALPGIQAEHLDLRSRAGTGKVTQSTRLLSSPSLIAVSAAARLQGAQRSGKHFDWAPVLLRAAN